MSRVRPVQKPRRFRTAHALLLAAGTAGVFLAVPGVAQEGGLRGSALDNAVRPTASSASAQFQAPAYVPYSPGAVPDEPAIAGSSQPDDPIAAAPAPVRRPAAATDVDPTSTGTVRTPTVDSENDQPLDEGAQRAEAIEGLDREAEENPFEAPGIPFGSFVLKPTLEQGITATDNADSTATGSDAILSETILRLNAASEWESNSATIDAFGIYNKTISGDEVDDLSGGIDGAVSLDLGKEYRVRGALGYAIKPESASSPVAVANAISQPIRQTITGSLGFDKEIGKARFGITGGIEHDMYGDADLEDGTTLSQKDRNSTLYTLKLRGGYEISPAITPFLETEVGRRIYELSTDAAGYQRSSDRYGARAGVAVDLGEKFAGELSGGWIREEFDDPRLEAISGPSVAGELRWSPERGTNVGLSGSTTVEGTTSAGESGSILYSSRLTVDRQIRSNLTGTAALGLAWRDYTGTNSHDLIWNAETSLTWWLNRYAGLTTRARHETVESNIDGRDSRTNSIFLGLKVQR